MNIINYGEHKILIQQVGVLDKVDLAEYLKEKLSDVSIRFGLESILIDFSMSDLPANIDMVNLILKDWEKSSNLSYDNFTTHIVNVKYFGEDIEHVSKYLNMSIGNFINYHSSIEWVVGMIGFAPGFPYLVPVDVEHRELINKIPRLSTPRSKVPEGSVAIAAGMSSIYPKEMPGGWNLIGLTDFKLFDVNERHPSVLKVNDRIRFTPVEGGQ